MELWDAYDVNCNKIEGLVLVRGEKIPDNVLHYIVDIAVKHSDGTYLLMQRSINKFKGGLWELTAGGSVIKGETPLEGARRELREETGIVSDSLKEVGKILSIEKHAIFVEFYCEVNIDKNSIILQEGETQDYKWVNKEEIIQMKNDYLITERIQKFLVDFNK